MEQQASEGANPLIPDEILKGDTDDYQKYIWYAIIAVFIFYFFELQKVFESCFKSTKRSLARPESNQSRQSRQETIREVRLRQQTLIDKLSTEAMEKGLIKRKTSKKEKRIKESTAYKLATKSQ